MKKFCAIVTLVILCLSVVSLFSFTVNAQQADSWPMFHSDLAHTGYSTESGPSANQTLWVFKTNSEVWSSPAVVNGIVYVASFDQNLYAINAKTGSKMWSYPLGNLCFSSPAVAHGLVYI